MVQMFTRRSTMHGEAATEVRVFALTGGPCGGKTSALASLSNKLPQISNFRVVQIPELSTLFHAAGSHYPANGTHAERLNCDLEKLKSQLALEDAFRNIAEKSGHPTILLCDRGALDTKLFVSSDDWVDLLSAIAIGSVYREVFIAVLLCMSPKRFQFVRIYPLLHLTSLSPCTALYSTVREGERVNGERAPPARDAERTTPALGAGSPR